MAEEENGYKDFTEDEKTQVLKAILQRTGVKLPEGQDLTAENVMAAVNREKPLSEDEQRAVAKYNAESNVEDEVSRKIFNRTGELDINRIVNTSDGIDSVELHRLMEELERREKAKKEAEAKEKAKTTSAHTGAGAGAAVVGSALFPDTNEIPLNSDFSSLLDKNEERYKALFHDDSVKLFRPVRVKDKEGNIREVMGITPEAIKALQNGDISKKDFSERLEEMGFNSKSIQATDKFVWAEIKTDNDNTLFKGFQDFMKMDHRSDDSLSYERKPEMDAILGAFELANVDGKIALKLKRDENNPPDNFIDRRIDNNAKKALENQGFNYGVQKCTIETPDHKNTVVVAAKDEDQQKFLDDLHRYQYEVRLDNFANAFEKTNKNGADILTVRDSFGKSEQGIAKAAKAANELGLKTPLTKNKDGQFVIVPTKEESELLSNVSDISDEQKNVSNITHNEQAKEHTVAIGTNEDESYDIYLSKRLHDKELMPQYRIPDADNLEDLICGFFVNAAVYANECARQNLITTKNNASKDKSEDIEQMRKEITDKETGFYNKLQTAILNGETEKALKLCDAIAARGVVMGKEGKGVINQAAKIQGSLLDVAGEVCESDDIRKGRMLKATNRDMMRLKHEATGNVNRIISTQRDYNISKQGGR